MVLARRSSPPDMTLGRNTRPSFRARPASPYPDNACGPGHFPGSSACDEYDGTVTRAEPTAMPPLRNVSRNGTAVASA